jgi:proton-translocating NADH-quinone oxidoreductase chain L
MDPASTLPVLLCLAWLLPLGSFGVIVLFGPRLGRRGIGAGYLATLAIMASFVLSLIATLGWLSQHPLAAVHGDAHAAGNMIQPLFGDWYALGNFGLLHLTIGYYIDSLTLVMFTMVTFVASCIHVYSFGYMGEELDVVTDPFVTLSDGRLLKRRGRFCRFYQYLSLFCFSMLGLVLAGNIAMVFVFWELVGICSYLLIGFYIERKSASNAANKAFIVNRVGDFGMLIGLMVIWSTLGTFSFPAIFDQVRPAEEHFALTVPDGMVIAGARVEVERIVVSHPKRVEADAAIDANLPGWREQGYGRWLLILAGLGIFCGCVGKSAQFPLHVWLPDAMEGPTPVSALIHAATMVAAGVYLIGRFYPVFTPEVLLVIACVGAITLFIAATIAITATDIKRVLAYSTVSQLGYMTLSLGLGGWVAGLFHLITHAFFKSLLFLCSGSVIHACETNEMPEMGGLRRKMPWTAYTMLAGCLAISGAGIPLVVGLSGYYSKDSILAQAFSFKLSNPTLGVFFYVAAGGAAITAFYMFRLWFMTFAGQPRNAHVAHHAHESPGAMVGPLVALAVFAVAAGWNLPFTNLGVRTMLEQAQPAGTAVAMISDVVTIPAESASHEAAIHTPVSFIAFFTALTGFLVATAYYGLRWLDPERARRMFAPIYWFLRRKWLFDELYRFLFIQPVLLISRAVAALDKNVIDGIADGLAWATTLVARLDDAIDRWLVDGLVNAIARRTYSLGIGLRSLQTGHLRQYVLWLALGTVGLFVLASLYWDFAR